MAAEAEGAARFFDAKSGGHIGDGEELQRLCTRLEL